MSPARLRVSCLLLVTLATLIHLVGGSVAWQAAGIVALLLYLVTLKGQLTRMAKGCCVPLAYSHCSRCGARLRLGSCCLRRVGVSRFLLPLWWR